MTKKRIISLLTAAAVCAGMSVPAFADEITEIPAVQTTVEAETADSNAEECEDFADEAVSGDAAEPEDSADDETDEPVVEVTDKQDGDESISDGLIEDDAEYYASGRFGENNSLTWTLSSGRLTITGKGAMPDYIWDFNTPWANHRSSIREIVVAAGITRIGDSSFGGCSDATTVRINPSVESIGEGAFEECESLTEIVIPDADIEYGAFEDCRSLRKVTIQSGTAKIAIEGNAFKGCDALTSINLPSAIVSIGSHCFEGCTSLGSVTIPGSVKEIPADAFFGCTALERAVIDSGVQAIGVNAFRDCTALKGVRIPATVHYIGSNAFDGCISLNSIALPDTSIGDLTFYGCENLARVTMTAGSEGREIGYKAFYDCSRLSALNLPSNITSIGSYCFSGCTSLKSAVIPERVKEISDGVFYGCTALSSVKLHDSIHTIGREAFRSCTSLKSITIPNANIEGNAFQNCSGLTNVTIKSGSAKREIAWYAFSRCDKLTSIVIPNSVSYIGSNTFEYCTSLKKAVLPEGLVKISSSLFYGCKSLAAVNIPSSVKTIESAAFSNCPLRHIHIASGKKVSEYAGKGGLPSNSGYYFTVNSGKCSSANCPLGSGSSAQKNTVPATEFDVKCVFGGRQVVFRAKGTSNQNIRIYYTTENRSTLRTTDKYVTNGGGALFTNFYGTVYARAYYNGQWGNVSRLILKIPTVNKPTLTRSKNKVTIKTSTPDAYVIYTTDGSAPSLKNGKRVKAPATITVSKGQKIRAIAVRSGYSNSGENSLTVSSVS